jgi:hypothetical protein
MDILTNEGWVIRTMTCTAIPTKRSMLISIVTALLCVEVQGPIEHTSLLHEHARGYRTLGLDVTVFGPIVWGKLLGYLLTAILGSSTSSHTVLRRMTTSCSPSPHTPYFPSMS